MTDNGTQPARGRKVAWRRAGLVAVAIGLALAAWLGLSGRLGGEAPAADAPEVSYRHWVIGAGQEAAVMRLFEPHRLTSEVAHGYALWEVRIEAKRVRVELRRGDERTTSFSLVHPDEAPAGARRSKSFAWLPGFEWDPKANEARDVLLGLVERNDAGGPIWKEMVVEVPDAERAAEEAQGRIGVRFDELGWVPIDGIALVLLVYLLALLLAGRMLVEAPRWTALALLAIVTAGVLLRLAYAPDTFLGAWPWSRVYPNVRTVADGSWLAVAAESAGHGFYLTDVAGWTNFAYAAVMPLVLFSHASYLLRDTRAGLVAAFAIAFLPQHIRYSRCEDGFVASLVLTSLAFALIHGWLRDPSRRVRWLMLFALPWTLYPGYLLRPLNILFVVVYVGAILFLHRETAPRARRLAALVIVVTVGVVALNFMAGKNSGALSAVTEDLGWVLESLTVLVTPKLLVLSDVSATPIVLMALAVAGAVLTWRAGERLLVLFLVGWLLMFVVAHAVVLQETMMPRYHLHLVVPFLLLGATAVPRLAARWRPALWGGAALMAAAPWLHAGFIAYTDYTELHEFDLVRAARDVVPEGCTVVEYTGAVDGPGQLRFERIGARVGGERTFRYRAVGVGPEGRTPDGGEPLDEVLRERPACLYLYEGLACSSATKGAEKYASDCLALRERLKAEPVLSAEAPVRFYDAENGASHLYAQPSIPLRLSRARLFDVP